jgi:hypothetical protein
MNAEHKNECSDIPQVSISSHYSVSSPNYSVATSPFNFENNPSTDFNSISHIPLPSQSYESNMMNQCEFVRTLQNETNTQYNSHIIQHQLPIQCDLNSVSIENIFQAQRLQLYQWQEQQIKLLMMKHINNNISDHTHSSSTSLTVPSLPSFSSYYPYSKPADYISMIDCGCINRETNSRITSIYIEYFGKEMDVYTADNDPQLRILFRGCALSEKFHCTTSKVGMYLQRRRGSNTGIFQAIGFRNKQERKVNVKAKSYFLSIEACMEFEKHFYKCISRK